jgi:hypothetical protein
MGGWSGILILVVLVNFLLALILKNRVNWSLNKAVGVAFVPVLVFIVPLFFSNTWYNQVQIQELITQFEVRLEQAELPAETDLDALKEQWRLWGPRLVKLSPGFIASLLLVLIYINAWLLKKWLAFKTKVSGPEKFTKSKLPDFIIWFFLIPALLLLLPSFGAGFIYSEKTVFFFGNILVMILPLYFWQGVLIAYFKMVNWKIPAPAAGLVLVLTLFLFGTTIGFFVNSFLFLLGIMDTWFDFRRVNKIYNGGLK